MKLTSDLREFIESLNSAEVDYLIVGGHAVAFHGYPRFTGDLDIWVRADTRNAERLAQVFESFGLGPRQALVAIFSTTGKMVQLGLPPNRIDVITKITGVEFEEAWSTRVSGQLDGLEVELIGLEALLRNKKASGRPKDLVDVDVLSKRVE
jgi:hypothetical protein